MKAIFFLLLGLCIPLHGQMIGASAPQSLGGEVNRLRRREIYNTPAEHNFYLGINGGLALGFQGSRSAPSWTAGLDLAWLMHKPVSRGFLHSFMVSWSFRARGNHALRTAPDDIELEAFSFSFLYGLGLRLGKVRLVFDGAGFRAGMILQNSGMGAGFGLILPLGFTVLWNTPRAIVSLGLQHSVVFAASGYAHYSLTAGFGFGWGGSQINFP